MERRPNVGDPSPHFDGEREGVYADNEGKEVGISMDGDPKKEVNQNPMAAANKADPEKLKLNNLIQGRDENNKKR